MLSSDETIVALATAPGMAGVAIIRLSGNTAHYTLGKIFRPRSGKAASSPARRPRAKLVYGTVIDDDQNPIDDCLAVTFAAPQSFTGEDVAEVHCHGSAVIVRRIIELCVQYGARPAQPGEFSRRAFMNGKMDLAQAEALSDLIAANSEAARRLALRQLRGGLSQQLRTLYSGMIDAAAEIEAHIDFPEEDIPPLARDRILDRMNAAIEGMEQLLAGHDKARLYQEGIRVILAGKPNAGKSSLFNALAGRERAIVSPHPGTTRDTLEVTVELGGIAFTLVDTAGLREEAEEIEQIGIERAREEILQADLVLYLSESDESGLPYFPSLEGVDPEKTIRVWTKRDHSGEPVPGQDGADASTRAFDLQISASIGSGLDNLEKLVLERTVGAGLEESDAGMSRVRHAENLRQARESARRAVSAFQAGESGDLVMVDLRDALSFIGEILGERLDEQILDRIFSTFCLGK